MNIIRYAVAVALLSAVISGQARPTFEVASIRQSAGDRNNVTVGVRITGSQVRISEWPLKEYIALAYNVRPQQISGPDWLTDQVFDIAGTIPAGVSSDLVPQMFQALLEDRFQLKAHRETREFPVYALGVAQGGLKIKELPADPLAPVAAPTNIEASGSGGGVFLDAGGGSTFQLGNNRLEIRKMTVSDFAGMITRFLDRPAVDFTGLSGRYDMTLELAPEDYTAMLMRAAVGAGVKLPPQALQLINAGSGNPLKASMERVGFTVDTRNAPLDFLVIDSTAKTPTEN